MHHYFFVITSILPQKKSLSSLGHCYKFHKKGFSKSGLYTILWFAKKRVIKTKIIHQTNDYFMDHCCMECHFCDDPVHDFFCASFMRPLPLFSFFSKRQSKNWDAYRQGYIIRRIKNALSALLSFKYQPQEFLGTQEKCAEKHQL